MSQVFSVSRGDVWFQADLATPAFGLFQDLPALFAHLFPRLAIYGLTPGDMRFESHARNLTDTVLADCEVALTFFGYAAVLRARVDRIEFRCPDITRVDQAQMASLVVDALEALNAYFSGNTFRTFTWALGLHGLLPGTTAKDFTLRLFGAPPPSVAPLMGSAAVFYYGADSGQITSSVTIDLSALIENGLYFRTHVVWDASRVDIRSLPETAVGYRNAALSAHGLELGA